MTDKYNDTKTLFSLIKKESTKSIPLGFNLIRPIKTNKTHDFVIVEKSIFHQTDSFGVGSYYKPIANILDEEIF